MHGVLVECRPTNRGAMAPTEVPSLCLRCLKPKKMARPRCALARKQRTRLIVMGLIWAAKRGGLFDLLKDTDVVDGHELRKGGGGIGVAGPLSAYRYVEDEEEGIVKRIGLL